MPLGLPTIMNQARDRRLDEEGRGARGTVFVKTGGSMSESRPCQTDYAVTCHFSA